MRRRFALFLLALPVRAGAEPAPTAVHLTYDGYASGFHVVTLESDLLLAPTGYRIAISGHTVGMVGLIYHASWQTTADGAWNDAAVMPMRFENSGVFGGQPRHVIIDFIHGDPVLRLLQPPDDGEHLPASLDVARHAIDSLSVTALLIRQAAMLGHCEGQTVSFDGRQVDRMDFHAAGAEYLPPATRSTWHGPTLRCDLSIHVLSGFFRDDRAELRDHVDTIWLGNVLRGVPALPVRMAVLTYHLGLTTFYLTKATSHETGHLTATQP